MSSPKLRTKPGNCSGCVGFSGQDTGRAAGEALGSWPQEVRTAVRASGGFKQPRDWRGWDWEGLELFGGQAELKRVGFCCVVGVAFRRTQMATVSFGV